MGWEEINKEIRIHPDKEIWKTIVRNSRCILLLSIVQFLTLIALIIFILIN